MSQNSPIRILYLCSSQFSGTTLTSFLLNNHKDVATIGHTTGWRYRDDEDFRCSCGERITDCPLFQYIRRAFDNNNLRFDPQNFGTAFRLSDQPRLNQLLTGPLPLVQSSRLEKWRDHTVALISGYRDKLERQQYANYVLMKSVVDYFSSALYLDNSHSPFRLRILEASPYFSVLPIHLVRDPRGVTLSLMTNSGFTLEHALDSWIKHQLNILRITEEIGNKLLLRYESLCTNTNEELARIHDYAGLSHEPFGGDFKTKPHHILGNRMRLTDGHIRLDERWRSDLTPQARKQIEHRLEAFCLRHASHPLTTIISDYLGD